MTLAAKVGIPHAVAEFFLPLARTGEMLLFASVLTCAGSLTLPVISLAYLFLRLPSHQDQLLSLFTRDEILPRYLAIRGRRVKKQADEPQEIYAARLRKEFDLVFLPELQQEYGIGQFIIPMLLAWIATSITVLFLVTEGFGRSLRPGTPPAVLYAELGALFYGVRRVIKAYTATDLAPATFFWVFVRYILALAYGLLANQVFTASLANLGAFVAAIVPFKEGISFIQSRLPSQAKWWLPERHPRLSEIQGLDPSAIEKLEELGVHTTQQLAFSDPLKLLLRTNFSPKMLIDWMDQAILSNYVGDQIAQLRPRGIGGAIELADVLDQEDLTGLIRSMAGVLKMSEDDVLYLVHSLYVDNQVQLLREIWGSFEEESSEGEAPK